MKFFVIPALAFIVTSIAIFSLGTDVSLWIRIKRGFFGGIACVAGPIAVARFFFDSNDDPKNNLFLSTSIFLQALVAAVVVFLVVRTHIARSPPPADRADEHQDSLPIAAIDEVEVRNLEQEGKRKKTLDFLLFVRMQQRLMKDEESIQASLIDIDNEINSRWRSMREIPLWDNEVAEEFEHVVAQFSSKGASDDYSVKQFVRLFAQAKELAASDPTHANENSPTNLASEPESKEQPDPAKLQSKVP